jgi:puromycin-sensitive aminopeptidase
VLPALERLGWAPRPDERDRDRELRAALIGAAVTLAGDPASLEQARELFRAVRDETTEVEPNVAGAAVRAVATFATEQDLDELTAGFRAGGTPQEEQRYLFAMAEIRDPALFQRVLDLATSSEVRTQNAPYLLGACIANRDNGPVAWQAVRDRWDELNERFPSNSIPRMLNGIRSLADPAVAADVEAFLDAHPVPQGKQAIAQHLERMQVTVALGERITRG